MFLRSRRGKRMANSLDDLRHTVRIEGIHKGVVVDYFLSVEASTQCTMLVSEIFVGGAGKRQEIKVDSRNLNELIGMLRGAREALKARESRRDR